MSILSNLKLKSSGKLVMDCELEGRECEISHSSRRVFIFDKKYVVKFDNEKNTCGRQNEKEVENFECIDEIDRKHFAQILESGYVQGIFCVVQEYVENEVRLPTPEECEQYHYILEKYNLGDFSSNPMYENRDNVALTKDGFKFYDIGYEDFSSLREETTSWQLGLF